MGVNSRDLLFEAIFKKLLDYSNNSMKELVFITTPTESKKIEIIGERHRNNINKKFIDGLLKYNLTSEDFVYSYKNFYFDKNDWRSDFAIDGLYAIFIKGKSALAEDLINTIIANAMIDETFNNEEG